MCKDSLNDYVIRNDLNENNNNNNSNRNSNSNSNSNSKSRRRTESESYGVVRSRLESFGVVWSLSESSGVTWSRSRPESLGVVRNRSWSESLGAVWFDVLVIRHFLSLCFLPFTLRVHSADSRWLRMTTSATDSGWLQTTLDNFKRLRNTPDDSRRLRTTPTLQVILNDSGILRLRTTPDDPRLLRTTPNDSGYCSADLPSGVHSEFIGVGWESTTDFSQLYPSLKSESTKKVKPYVN